MRTKSTLEAYLGTSQGSADCGTAVSESTLDAYIGTSQEQEEKRRWVMDLSVHGREQMSRRGIPEPVIGIVIYYGRMQHARGGAHEYFFGNSEATQALEDLAGKRMTTKLRARRRQTIERAIGTTLIAIGNSIITAYHRDKPRHPKKRRPTSPYKPNIH